MNLNDGLNNYDISLHRCMIQDSFTTFSFNMKYQEDVFKILLKIK